MNIQLRLAAHLQKSAAAPFLFVGSGLSRRYLGLEDWKSLLERFSAAIGADFSYLISKADGDLPRVASLLAKEFQDPWFKGTKFKASRAAFKAEATRADSPLKIEIAKYIENLDYDPDDAAVTEELDALKQAHIDGIITTNWDLLLEKLFPDYQVFKGQEELLFSNPQSIAEIYKIHGCCTAPNSLVLTEDDYRDFDARNPYLAAKLLTIFIEHPIIFIGYSLSDKNIIRILNSITSCLRSDNLQKLHDRLIFVQRAGGQEDEITSSVLAIDGKALPVVIVRTDDFSEVYKALSINRRKFPARILRRLKSQIYDLVKNNDPHSQIYVADLEQESDVSKIEIVYGIGISRKLGDAGYVPIRAEDLMRDVVYDHNHFEVRKIVEQTLPVLMKSSRYVPVFKYLRNGGYVFGEGRNLDGVTPLVAIAAKATRNNFLTNLGSESKKVALRALDCRISGLQERFDLYHVAMYIPYLSSANLSAEELRDFLHKNFDALIVKNSTVLRKLVCLYDLLKYGPS